MKLTTMRKMAVQFLELLFQNNQSTRIFASLEIDKYLQNQVTTLKGQLIKTHQGDSLKYRGIRRKKGILSND